MERDFNFYRKYILELLQEYEAGNIPLQSLVSDVENTEDLLALSDMDHDSYENTMVGLEEVNAILLDDPLSASKEEYQVIIHDLIRNIRDIISSSDK